MKYLEALETKVKSQKSKSKFYLDLRLNRLVRFDKLRTNKLCNSPRFEVLLMRKSNDNYFTYKTCEYNNGKSSLYHLMVWNTFLDKMMRMQ